MESLTSLHEAKPITPFVLNRTIHNGQSKLTLCSNELQLSFLQQTANDINALFVQNETSEGQSFIAEPL